MTAEKNNPNPGKEKTYQKYDYRLPIATMPPLDNSAQQKHIPVNDESLDHLIRPPAYNESHQHAPKAHGERTPSGINPQGTTYSSYVARPTHQRETYPTSLYDLSQPIWFYMIMKKLAAEKGKKK